MEEGKPYIDKRHKKERKTDLVKKSLSKKDISNKGTRYPLKNSVHELLKTEEKEHTQHKPVALMEWLN